MLIPDLLHFVRIFLFTLTAALAEVELCLVVTHWPTESMYFVEIPIKDLSSDDKKATSTMRVPMVLPHELLCYLMDAWIRIA